MQFKAIELKFGSFSLHSYFEMAETGVVAAIDVTEFRVDDAIKVFADTMSA